MKKSIRGIRCLLALAAVFVFSGCASTMMTQTHTITAPPEGTALVTFFRPTMFGGAIQFGLWDSDKFIGILSAKSYVQYAAQPGEHIFMARAENWSYVKANLEAGKEYYIIGRVIMGVWKARVALSPIKKADFEKPGEKEKVAKWLQEMKPTTPLTEKVEAYVTPRRDQVRQSLDEYKAGKATYMVLDAADGR